MLETYNMILELIMGVCFVLAMILFAVSLLWKQIKRRRFRRRNRNHSEPTTDMEEVYDLHREHTEEIETMKRKLCPHVDLSPDVVVVERKTTTSGNGISYEEQRTAPGLVCSYCNSTVKTFDTFPERERAYANHLLERNGKGVES